MWALSRLGVVRLLHCALCLYLSVQICDAVRAKRSGKDVTAQHTASGCLHNNTLFADTSLIPSTEPCLRCKCSNKNLVCVRRVCKDLPYPPPRSCILVHKKSLCCPYLSCSKYHVNFYKNSERNRENFNQLEGSHGEKTLEKSSRTDDGEEEAENGGCIESGSLYASGSAMVKSSSTLCSFCYCINGQRKCVKPKCMLPDTKCKPIFMDASCCPVKYDCAANSTSHDGKHVNHKALTVQRKNRSNGCFDSGTYYQEGEKLPSNVKRPCEMCYCIKGLRKCVVKKCAPLIRGCIPKILKAGSCCPTNYDCSRSLKLRRQVRQNNDDEPEDDIDFFSLLFGSDEPQEEEVKTEKQSNIIEVTTLQPFKALPSTEKSFFDFIRAGLEIIDANADKFALDDRSAATLPPAEVVHENLEITTVTSRINSEETSTAKFAETTQKLPSSLKSTLTSTTKIKLPENVVTSSSESTSSSPKLATTTAKPASTTPATAPPRTDRDSTTKLAVSSSSTVTTLSPSTKIKATTRRTPATTKLQTTRKVPPPSTKTAEKLRETTPKVLIETSTSTTTTTTPRTTLKFISTTTENHQHAVHFNVAAILPDTRPTENDDDNEAETLPKIEIIPFVAHDAIDTDKPFEPYPKPYENLEKDYFANDKAKPFRYNNKFIHHSYDDAADYGYSNPHERIDNGPYYFETNDNQFDSFSPPSEQDFLGGFSPKESIYDEVSTIASPQLPVNNNDFLATSSQAAPTIHEHKSNVTSTEKTLTSPINQNTHDDAKQGSVIPGFKKITSNFTSFIDELLQGNVLEESTTAKVSSTTAAPATSAPSATSQPIKSIINDDEFIMKHLKAPSTPPAKKVHGMTEIFSKPTAPTMNGLLKLAGCNIYGQMYDVGHVIVELSNACLECKCLPDIGVGCTPKC